MLFSIVVPFYKIKKSVIEENVRSICAQTYAEIEVFLVDDGNTDETPSVLDRLAQEDSRLHVIHQKNSGVSASRNYGITAAKGEYIVFVDGDDVLAPYAIEKIYNAVESFKPDILYAEHIVSNHSFIFPENESGKAHRLPDKNIVMRSMISSTVSQEKGLHGAPWGKAFNTCFLRKNNLHFDTNLPRSQDNEFNFRTLQYTDKIYYLPVAIYGYRESAESAMTKYRKDSQIIQERYLDTISADIALYSKNDVMRHDLDVITVSKLFDICNTCTLHPDNPANAVQKLKGVKELAQNQRYAEALSKVSKNDFQGAAKIFVILLKKRMYSLFCMAHYCRRKIKKL